MTIRKAVITAAGQGQRSLPLQTLIDRDGTPKSALGILADEAFSAGIEEIAVIVSPGDESAFAACAGPLARRMEFIAQPAPQGFGHAVLCAAEFTGDEPFLLMVGDHLHLSRTADTCVQQLLVTAAAEKCAVSAVEATHESKLPFYGCVGGFRVAGRQRLYQIDTVLEKPTPTEAEQRLAVPGLRAGRYLCFFGMHVLPPAVMALLARQHENHAGAARTELSPALAELARAERYLAYEMLGHRHDIGISYGLLRAQLALALAGRDRDEVLSQLVELLAQSRESNQPLQHTDGH
jgi:UTP--glucose-1-phosphate uridylyltransferase